ncbi:DUF2846 domain-containing protein [Photobacterium angustum]|uniref:DUF2846 domain-containing protein n=1 Tax=Photobacterium angustum TaxID=661 RepID=A0A2S7W043_PHOAN|nr:DUF2846 domain-containing protein [Photobacterium angustum]KJG18907.1 hypothetical protein UA33_02385 [Photobacterium angustum]KJG25402.1 hypothetical protein UA39_05585 [Photobacterium angustum]KJG33715.1 hypothetical protein UA36_01635 [Photobacterium angustum]KJG34480.1 hypothetical protein UA69_01445 [Photobacterium angustum]KJG41899.1 hypothetical protein UA35_05060 [Photobacterium angustum]
MKYKLLISAALLGLSGCASVPTVDTAVSNEAKKFTAPEEGKAGIYIYREDSIVGGALKKYVYVDKECVGETAPGVFFYHEVKAGEEHVVSTESEFSENHITLFTEAGRNYFINQFIKIGAFVGGAGIELVDEEAGKAEVMKVKMAKTADCPDLT